MDSSTLDHSDSDSGESWTLLEDSPSCADEAPQVDPNFPTQCRDVIHHTEKDEDTDGISIISDSEPESPACDQSYDKCSLLDDDCPAEIRNVQPLTANIFPTSDQDFHGSVKCEEDFLGDNTKHKTYVHKRNKRLSTVLNIIVLGSVITAAGVAIGHMWGVKDDCSLHSTASVNKILSNLYKLQEENAYLRNKLRELSLASGIFLHQRKPEFDKVKQKRCKKIFEESLQSNREKHTKCIDSDTNFAEPAYEKEFINDINKLKTVYKQNKSILDEEITKRIQSEKQHLLNMKNNLKSTRFLKRIDDHLKYKPLKDKNIKRKLEISRDTLSTIEIDENIVEPSSNESINMITKHSTVDIINPEQKHEKKITYADSLKSGNKNEKELQNKRLKRQIHIVKEKPEKQEFRKKPKKEYETVSLSSDEDVLKKDDRHTQLKAKYERKKHDRQKFNKKQKRRNKYEQWEMKGGYMKDYDDVSMLSQENFLVQSKAPGFDASQKILESENDESSAGHKIKGEKILQNKQKNENESNWYEKRTAFRMEARKKLEQELFGNSTPNQSGWYFRRMQKREQCRSKVDNTTYKKLSKRARMNYKMKN